MPPLRRRHRFWTALDIVGLLAGSYLVLFGHDRYEWMWLILVVTSTMGLAYDDAARRRNAGGEDDRPGSSTKP